MKPITPQIHLITFISCLILALVFYSTFSISRTKLNKTSIIQITEKEEKISLQDAIAKKLVSVKFHGTGAAFGDAITVEVKNKTKFPLTIEVIPGTKLISDDTSKQNMVMGKVKGELVDETNYLINDFIEIQPKSKGKYILEAFCIESLKPEPTPSTSLNIAEIDSSILFMIQQGNDLDFSPTVIQSAIWIYLENKTDDQLKKSIEVNEDELQKANELIELLQRSRE